MIVCGGLDGLRTISMFMIILAHSALLSLMLGQDTTTGYMTYEEKLSSQFVLGVDKAVDTFFAQVANRKDLAGKVRRVKNGYLFVHVCVADACICAELEGKRIIQFSCWMLGLLRRSN